MSSKFGLAALLAVTIASVAACTVHEKTTGPGQIIDLSSAQLGCLNGSAKVIEDYLHGSLDSDQKIAGVWDCASQSLSLFGQKTRGANAGYYTPDELRGFLQKFFLSEMTISDGLEHEAMQLKRAMIGGDADRITQDDLARTQKLIALLKQATLDLRPYMPLTPEHMAKLPPETLDQAIQALVRSAASVGDSLQSNGYPYLFSDLAGLIQEFNQSGGFQYFEVVPDRMPLITALKSILIAPQGDRIAGNEWKVTLTVAARWYGVLLRASHLMEYDSAPSAWSQGDGMARFMGTVSDALLLLDEACARHTGSHQQITFEEMDSLVDALTAQELQLWRGQLEPQTVKDFLRVVFRKFLSFGQPGLEGTESLGLDSSAIDRIRQTLAKWEKGQQFLELSFARASALAGGGDAAQQGFSTAGPAGPASLKTDLWNPDGYLADELLGASLSDLLGKSPSSPDFVQEAQALSSDIELYPPFFAADDSLISFPGGGARRYSFHGLSEYHWMSELGELLEVSYAKDPKRIQQRLGVTLGELKEFFGDVEDFGVEMLVFDPTNLNMPQQRFQEANLFLYASDGNDLLGPDETTQLLAFLLSAKRLSTQMHDQIAAACPNGPLDRFQYATIEPGCFRREFAAHFGEFTGTMPLMEAYFSRLSPAERQRFERDLEDTARANHYSQDWFDTNDFDGITAVLQYVEAVFARFDAKLSGTLDADDARAAFQVFKGTLQTMTHITDQKELEALFTYMLAKGEPPSRSLWGLTQLKYWEDLSKWDFQSDRGTMLHIMAQLAKNAGT